MMYTFMCICVVDYFVFMSVSNFLFILVFCVVKCLAYITFNHHKARYVVLFITVVH